MSYKVNPIPINDRFTIQSILRITKLTIFILLCVQSTQIFSQDTIRVPDNRAQLNKFLSRGSVNVNFGYIQYPFSNANLTTDGYQAESVNISHFAARILLGYRINKTFSVHYSVMRAAIWPSYKFIRQDGNIEKHVVDVNEWGLTLKSKFPINQKNSVFVEGGIGLLSRNGFITGNERASISDQNYLTFLSAAGIQHKISSNWDGIFMATFSPQNNANKQPYTIFASLGFVYHMHLLSDEAVAKNTNSAYIFPKQYIQIGAASNVLGFTSHKLFSITGNQIGLPIFWKGKVQAQTGGAITYQKNVFHTKKVFSLDWGTSISFWQTEINKDRFFTISVFPVLRFWFLRTKFNDYYFVYSIVGPSYISNKFLDDRNTGENITYQDFMGFGSFFGKQRKLNAEIKILHYSNGNIFAINPGIDIPLMLNLGYAF